MYALMQHRFKDPQAASSHGESLIKNEGAPLGAGACSSTRPRMAPALPASGRPTPSRTSRATSTRRWATRARTTAMRLTPSRGSPGNPSGSPNRLESPPRPDGSGDTLLRSRACECVPDRVAGSRCGRPPAAPDWPSLMTAPPGRSGCVCRFDRARSSVVGSKVWVSGGRMPASWPRAEAVPIGRLTLRR